MATTYMIKCSECLKTFRTRRALEKHSSQRHPGHEIPERLKFFHEEHTVDFPGQKLIGDELEYHHYQLWLSDLVEGLNSAHNPKAPGMLLSLKWFTFD